MATKKDSLSCVSCGLRDGEDLQSPKMEPYGEGKKGILIIGEAPSNADDRKDMPWQGQTGRLLQTTLRQVGIDLFEDCVCVNAVNCRPPKNRTPKPFEIACCREVMVKDAINSFTDHAPRKHTLAPFGPRVIVLLGTVAIQSFLGERWKTDLGGFQKWRGFQIPDQDYRSWVVPTFHPSYVVRMDSREIMTVWKQDLQKVVEAVDKPFPSFPQPDIRILEDDLSPLSIIEEGEVAIDYETTGLKSYGKGHRIVCASVAVNDTLVYAFMMPPSRAQRKPFTDLLENPNIGKMAHNMKYEHAWTLNRLKIEVQNWQWDSMYAAHIIDNRSGITNLKFQTYMNFGMIIKDEDVGKFIYKKQDSGNGFNLIFDLLEEEGGEEKLLRHVALDSHYEYQLAKLQMEQLNYSYLPF